MLPRCARSVAFSGRFLLVHLLDDVRTNFLRERRDFFSGVRSFRPVISLILLRTSSAAARKSASDVALASAEGERQQILARVRQSR